MTSFLAYLTREMTRKIFRVPSNIIERTASQIQVNHKKIRNEYSSCNVSTSQVEMPVIMKETTDFQTPTTTQSKIIATPAFPDASEIGAVTWVRNTNEAVNLYDIIMKIETDKTFVYISAPSDGTIAELLVSDGASVRPGQDLFKFKATASEKDGVKKLPPPSRKPDKIIAAPGFPDSSETGLVKWIKGKNVPVDPFEIILRIETDQTFVYVPAPAGGTIVKTLVKDGDRIRPGQNLFKFHLKDAVVAAPEAKPTEEAVKITPPTTTLSKIDIPPKHPHDNIAIPPYEKPPSMPNLSSVSSTKPTLNSRSEYRVNINRMGSTTASKLTGPANSRDMLTTLNEVDMGNVIIWRKQNLKAFQEKHGTKFGFMSLFCKACACALKELPRFNAVIDGSDIVYHNYVDISVPLKSPKGIVIPVLRNVERMNCADIAKQIGNLSNKVKTGDLKVEDVKGGTFTITNAGKFGALMGTPIATQPKSSVLGMHGIFDRPVAYKGKTEIRPMMYVALTYDHRLVDGTEASLFLNKVKSCVEETSKIAALAGM